MFAARDDHVLFFDAADDVDYGFAVAGDGSGARRRRGDDRAADQEACRSERRGARRLSAQRAPRASGELAMEC